VLAGTKIEAPSSATREEEDENIVVVVDRPPM
jgi:hypothetical protein